MALLTLHRSPSVCTPDESIQRRGRLQKRESFALVKGAVLLLEEGGAHVETTPSIGLGGGASDTQHRHLRAMVSLLRPEDTVKLAVRMNSDQCTIGLVLPVWSDTQVYLDGDGSVLQALHGCCERAVRGAVIPGCGLDWATHYRRHVESDRYCLNEWTAMTGLESVRKDSKGSSTERESVEREIKAQLRDIMRTEDLENITSKEVRSALEERIGIDMKNYKEYIDNEMMVTMAQMDKPSKILDYLYLGSEWNAANFEELQKNNVGYILNVTMEIDNFFPRILHLHEHQSL
ncbi:hypothetical protein MHYP_G00107380 [Metynnis hypsauchen]